MAFRWRFVFKLALTFLSLQTWARPDLVVTSVSISPRSPVQAGASVKFTAVVRNIGTSSTPAGVTLGVGFLVDGQIAAWSASYSKALRAGASVTLVSDGGPNGGVYPAAPGSHVVRAHVNDVQRFSERSFANNTREISIVVNPTPAPAPVAEGPGLGAIMGSGNLLWGTTPYDQQLAALNLVGAKMSRVNIYPSNYYVDSTGTTMEKNLDAAILAHFRAKIRPIVLFEYYGFFSEPIGDYNKWYKIGRAFAQRFGPGGTLGQENGFPPEWGVTVFEAINEPDINSPAIPFAAYRNALKGLADGVHSINPTSKVIPAGFASPNAYLNYTANGYVPAIADLLNNGTLDGLDLHIYYNLPYFPIGMGHTFSAQHTFTQIKRASGITRDINYYTTEFNFAGGFPQTNDLYNPSGSFTDENYAARMFLTALWDNIGVTRNNGTPATQLAFPWSLFPVEDVYTMSQQLSPFQPRARARTWQLVLELTRGMSLISSDPDNTGVIVLSGGARKMWVFQNWPGWSSLAGTSFVVNGIPQGARVLKVYDWSGNIRTLDCSGKSSVTVTGLAPKNTVMFVAE